MARTSPAIRPHARGFKRMLLTMLILSCLGWLVLFVDQYLYIGCEQIWAVYRDILNLPDS